MRLVADRQRTLSFYTSTHSFKQQWDTISAILDAKSEIAELVWRDLATDKLGELRERVGAKGMTAEQVLRCAIVKMKEQLSYRDLRDRVDDSIVLRDFCRLGHCNVPVFTTLQNTIKRIRPETWEAINGLIIGYAQERKIEDGKRVRIDTTGVESNIHHPTDSHQLWDCVRVLTRTLERVETDIARLRGRFHDHRRMAKRKFYRIHNTRGKDNKKPLYRQLIAVTKRVVAYAHEALPELAAERCESFEESLIAAAYAGELRHYLPLAEAVISQSERRVLRGEDVSATEKTVSIFEPHTDIIKKGQREIVYGHKVLFTAGKSNLILDCIVERGNPADAAQFIPALERQREQFGQVAKQVATDAGFASKANARHALANGVDDLAFVAPAAKTIPEIEKNSRAYKRLKKWRAGIEGIISATKRAFGLTRCDWHGFESFKAYVQLSVLAFNLQTLARHLLV